MNNEKAKVMLKGLSEIQFSDNDDDFLFPCPRCGHENMDKKAVMNSLSRRIDVYICNDCGTDEAMEDMLGNNELELKDWSFVKSMVGTGFK